MGSLEGRGSGISSTTEGVEAGSESTCIDSAALAVDGLTSCTESVVAALGGTRRRLTWLSQTSLSHSYTHRPYGPVLSASVMHAANGGTLASRSEDDESCTKWQLDFLYLTFAFLILNLHTYVMGFIFM